MCGENGHYKSNPATQYYLQYFMEYLPRVPLSTLPDRFRLYFRVWEYELCC